jgi:site-specific DNA recombinase
MTPVKLALADVPKRAAIYARFSHADQIGGFSIQAQLRACQELAKREGWTVVHEYIDEARSAFRHPEKREAFQALLRDATAKDRPFEVVVVHMLDRFSRNTAELITTRDTLLRCGIGLRSASEPAVGIPSVEGRFLEHIMMAIPEYQSGHQGRHILKGLTERVRAGFLVTAAPFGMKRELVKIEAGRNGKNRLFSKAVSDERTAHIALEAFQRYDQGEGFKAIAQSFTAKGYRTKTSKPFAVETIRRLLANAAYMGVMEYHVRGKFGAPDELITVPGFYPQLVPQALFRCVQEKLAANAVNYRNSYAQRTTYLLSRLGRCHCGAAYVGASAKGGQYHYYVCLATIKRGKIVCPGRRLSKDRFEQAIVERLQQQVLTVEAVTEYIRAYNEQVRRETAVTPAEVARLDRALAEVTRKVKKWYEAVETESIALEDVAERLQELKAERRSLEDARRDVLRKEHTAEERVIPAHLVRRFTLLVIEKLKAAGFGYKREFLKEVIDHFVVGKRSVTVFWKLPLRQGTTRKKDEFSILAGMVEGRGFEPPTSALRTPRSPN